ncbi:MAG: hypothetical protein NVS2B16_37570 [Chloroflexota bacterium]
MPPDVTVFAANHLTYVDVILAALVMTPLLWLRHHAAQLCWAVTTALMTLLSYEFSRLGSALYNDPRPFVSSHFVPLLPHTANNGFPPGHAVLAAVVLSSVLFLSRKWAIPFFLLALLVDWARVGVGIVNVVDIAGAWGFVMLATMVAWMIGPTVTGVLLTRLPATWSSGRFMLPIRAGSQNNPAARRV